MPVAHRRPICLDTAWLGPRRKHGGIEPTLRRRVSALHSGPISTRARSSGEGDGWSVRLPIVVSSPELSIRSAQHSSAGVQDHRNETIADSAQREFRPIVMHHDGHLRRTASQPNKRLRRTQEGCTGQAMIARRAPPLAPKIARRGHRTRATRSPNRCVLESSLRGIPIPIVFGDKHGYRLRPLR